MAVALLASRPADTGLVQLPNLVGIQAAEGPLRDDIIAGKVTGLGFESLLPSMT